MTNQIEGSLTGFSVGIPNWGQDPLEAQFVTSGNFVGFWPTDQCFLAGTPVTLANETKNTIETILPRRHCSVLQRAWHPRSRPRHPHLCQ
jgi:hypothetical protein